jgi:hypothetical protein
MGCDSAEGGVVKGVTPISIRLDWRITLMAHLPPRKKSKTTTPAMTHAIGGTLSMNDLEGCGGGGGGRGASAVLVSSVPHRGHLGATSITYSEPRPMPPDWFSQTGSEEPVAPQRGHRGLYRNSGFALNTCLKTASSQGSVGERRSHWPTPTSAIQPAIAPARRRLRPKPQ